MRNVIVLLFVAIFFRQAAWPQSVKAVLGSWEGESKCTVPNSPCHDEHVLYQISLDKKDPEQLNLDGYKIVDGNPEFMGTLTCRYHSREQVLSCTANTSQHDDWEFHVTGNTMAGRLTINESKTVYRRIMVHKSEAK